MVKPTSPPIAPFTVGGVVLDAVTAQRFELLAPALETDASLLALLPEGSSSWEGSNEIVGVFQRWFADADCYEVLDASVGQIGALLALRWRLRLAGGRLGPAVKVIEQHVYAAPGPSGRISRLSLLSSGYWEEASAPAQPARPPLNPVTNQEGRSA